MLRPRHVILSSLSVLCGSVAYDQYEIWRIKEKYRQQASQLSEHLIGDIAEQRESIRVYLSVTSKWEGSSYKEAFEKSVKYVWDAAYLDYEVVEGWQWFDNTRPRVCKDALQYVKSQSSQNDKNSLPYELALMQKPVFQEPRMIVVGMGRAAFKATVTGLQDCIAHVQLDPELQQRAETDLENETGSVKNSNNSWWNLTAWWKRKPDQSATELPAVESDEHKEADVQLAKPRKELPIIGYIPFTYHHSSRLRRFYYSWLAQRYHYEEMGKAALAIAVGRKHRLSELFPGGHIQLTIEETELRAKEDEGEDSAKPKQSKDELKDELPEHDKFEAGQTVIVDEPYVDMMLIFYHDSESSSSEPETEEELQWKH